MSFFEQIAAALDREDIESRVNGDTLFVPITMDLEVQFVTIDDELPAAEVYVAAADVDSDDDDFEAVLVSVVFSVEDAVEAVAHHVATDRVVTLLRVLLDGEDDRVSDLEFEQDAEEATLVTAEVGEASLLQVLVTANGNEPVAHVRFIAQDENLDDIVDQAIAEFWDSDTETILTDDDRRKMFADLYADAASLRNEVLTLGAFTDFDKLLDVLSLAADRAEEWEDQLAPVEDGFAESLYSTYQGDDWAEDDDYDDNDEDDRDDEDDFDDDELDDDGLDDEESDGKGDAGGDDADDAGDHEVDAEQHRRDDQRMAGPQQQRQAEHDRGHADDAVQGPHRVLGLLRQHLLEQFERIARMARAGLPVGAAGVSLMAAIVRGAALGVGVLGVLGVVLVVAVFPAVRVGVARIGRVCSILRLAAGLLAVGIEAVDVLIRHGMLLDLVKRHVASLLSSIVVVSVRHRD